MGEWVDFRNDRKNYKENGVKVYTEFAFCLTSFDYFIKSALDESIETDLLVALTPR